MMARMMSLAVTPFGRLPCTRMCKVLDRLHQHCVAAHVRLRGADANAKVPMRRASSMTVTADDVCPAE